MTLPERFAPVFSYFKDSPAHLRVFADRLKPTDPYAGPKDQLALQGTKHIDRYTGRGQRYMWASDVSGTLLDRNTLPDTRLQEEVGKNDWLTVYVTGDSFTSVLRNVKQGKIPRPDIIAERTSGPIWCLRPESYGKDPKTLRPEDFVEDIAWSRRLQRAFPKAEIVGEVAILKDQLERAGFKDFDVRYRNGKGSSTVDPLRDIERPFAIPLAYTLPKRRGSKQAERLAAFHRQREMIIATHPHLSHLRKLTLLEFQNTTQAVERGIVEALLVPKAKDDVAAYLAQKLGIDFILFTGDSSMDPILRHASLDRKHKQFPRVWTGVAGRRKPDRLLAQQLQSAGLPTKIKTPATNKVEGTNRPLEIPLPANTHKGDIDRRIHRVTLPQRGKTTQMEAIVLLENTPALASSSVARHVAFANRVRRRYIDMPQEETLTLTAA